jgi:hypothetical protein
MTLGEFDVPIALYCFHCAVRLPKRAVVEINDKFAIVHCPRCKCMTPFQLQQP